MRPRHGAPAGDGCLTTSIVRKRSDGGRGARKLEGWLGVIDHRRNGGDGRKAGTVLYRERTGGRKRPATRRGGEDGATEQVGRSAPGDMEGGRCRCGGGVCGSRMEPDGIEHRKPHSPHQEDQGQEGCLPTARAAANHAGKVSPGAERREGRTAESRCEPSRCRPAKASWRTMGRTSSSASRTPPVDPPHARGPPARWRSTLNPDSPARPTASRRLRRTSPGSPSACRCPS